MPALKPKPFKEGEKLRKIEDLPEWARPAFAGMASLNRIQSRVCDTALKTAENMLLCAPTGAGKTNVALLTILHQIALHTKDGAIDFNKFKVVYVAPMKALVAEMVRLTSLWWTQLDHAQFPCALALPEHVCRIL